MTNLREMKAEELRTIAKSLQMPQAWKAKKKEMIEFIEANQAEQIIEVTSEVTCEEVNNVETSEEVVEEVKPKVKGREVLITLTLNTGEVLQANKWAQLQEAIGIPANAIWRAYKNRPTKASKELIKSITVEKV